MACLYFHQIFTYLTPNDVELIRFWGISNNNCCNGKLCIFGLLSLVGVPQTKPMLTFRSNFQVGFTTKESEAV